MKGFTLEWANAHNNRVKGATMPAGGQTPVKAKRTTNQGNIRCEVDGLHFQSKKEGERYLLLRSMERGGGITELKTQVKFILVNDANLNYKLAYFADFTYKIDGVLQVEDVKPFDKNKGEFRLSQTFKRKKKLMLKKYGIDVKIV